MDLQDARQRFCDALAPRRSIGGQGLPDHVWYLRQQVVVTHAPFRHSGKRTRKILEEKQQPAFNYRTVMDTLPLETGPALACLGGSGPAVVGLVRASLVMAWVFSGRAEPEHT